MAKIVEPPKPKHVKCNACAAKIEYLPEEVETRSARHFDETTVTKFIKCPRPGCPGDGIIDRY